MSAVIVTGGAGLLGAEICRYLVGQGADVGINCLNDDDSIHRAENLASELRASSPSKVIVLPADVSDEDHVDRMAAAAVAELGTLTGLVCNAAVGISRVVSWQRIPASDWNRVFQTNVLGAFLCARACFPHLEASGCGSIVLLSSVTALVGRTHNLSYVVSKAGLIGMTRSLAREVGPTGVRVNAVAPGAIQGDAEREFGEPNEVLAFARSVQSLTRRGTPGDVASSVGYLLSDESSFVTGQVLSVDGGWAMP